MITPPHRHRRSRPIWHALLLPSRTRALLTRTLYFNDVIGFAFGDGLL